MPMFTPMQAELRSNFISESSNSKFAFATTGLELSPRFSLLAA